MDQIVTRGSSEISVEVCPEKLILDLAAILHRTLFEHFNREYYRS